VVGLNAHDPQQGFHERECPVHKVCEKIVGRCYEKVLADRAVQATLDLTLEEIAEIQNGGQAAGGADNVTVLRCCRLRKSKHQGNHRDEYGDPTFHIFDPSQGSPVSKFLSL
jgi:hypothetical protein